MSGEFNFETLGNFDELPLTAQLQSYANNEAVFVDTNSSTGKSVTYHLLMAPIYKDVYSESDLVRMLPEQFGSFYFLERRHEEFNSGDEARYGYGVFTTPDFQRLLVEGHEQEYEKHWADEAEYNLPGFIHSEFSINQSNLDLYRTQRNLRLFPKENMPSVPYFINEINQNEEYTQLVVFNIATGAKITLYLSADEFSQSQWSNVKVKQTVSIQASSVAFDPEGQTDLVPFLEWQMPGIKNTVGVLRFEYKLDFRKIPSSLTVTPN
jgi:hypothetical protein